MTGQLFDVAIIGGGVAGCAAAIQLARYGHKVVLCEAQSYPHHKVCGEFLSPECAQLLGELGLASAIQKLNPASIHTVAITAPDGCTWEAELPGAAIGISRYALDHILAKQARSYGVDLRDKKTVTDIQGNLSTNFQLTVRTSRKLEMIPAKTVIGAHGKRSGIDRILNRSFLKKPQSFVGLKAHFYGPSLSGRIHLYSFPGGYCGMSEVEGGLTNVCLLIRQDVFQAQSDRSSTQVEGFIDWMKTQNSALGAWLSYAQAAYKPWLSIAHIPFVERQVVVNDVLMVGDAAELIAPVAGDGIAMALQSSQMVSELLDQYLNLQISAEMLRRQYTALWWDTFRVRLPLSRILQEFMLRPNWLIPGLRLMNAVPSLGRFLITHTRDNNHLIPSKGGYGVSTNFDN